MRGFFKKNVYVHNIPRKIKIVNSHKKITGEEREKRWHCNEVDIYGQKSWISDDYLAELQQQIKEYEEIKRKSK